MKCIICGSKTKGENELCYECESGMEEERKSINDENETREATEIVKKVFKCTQKEAKEAIKESENMKIKYDPINIGITTKQLKEAIKMLSKK